MLRSLATTCWDQPTMLVALTRNPARYVRLAQALIDAVPCTWGRISAHLVIAMSGIERCDIAATCGDAAPADSACRAAARKAIAEIARSSLIPDGAQWVGIWVDYDIDADSLTATIMHGGPAERSQPSPMDLVLAELYPEPSELDLPLVMIC